MITLRVWFVVVPLAILLAAGSAWTSVMRSAHGLRAVRPTTAISNSLDKLEPAMTDPRVDLYGNEIDDAVGDYRIDGRGDVYESHSPETEVPRPAPPVI